MSSRHDAVRVSLHLYNTEDTLTLYYTKSAATAHFSMCRLRREVESDVNALKNR